MAKRILSLLLLFTLTLTACADKSEEKKKSDGKTAVESEELNDSKDEDSAEMKSGLVPTVYLYSLMGIDATEKGLYIAPSFADDYEYMGVKKLAYGGKTYAVELNKNGSLTLKAEGGADGQIYYRPARFESFTLTVNNAKGETVAKKTVKLDENGYIFLDLSAYENGAELAISPKF